MGCLASQHAPDADDGIASSSAGELFRRNRYLQRTRNPDDLDLLFLRAGSRQSVQSPREKPVGYEAVELAYHDSKMQSRGIPFAAKYRGLSALWHSLSPLKLRRPLFEKRARTLA